MDEASYPQRAAKYTEIDLGVAVIDYYYAENKIIHEIKKSDKVEYFTYCTLYLVPRNLPQSSTFFTTAPPHHHIPPPALPVSC